MAAILSAPIGAVIVLYLLRPIAGTGPLVRMVSLTGLVPGGYLFFQQIDRIMNHCDLCETRVGGFKDDPRDTEYILANDDGFEKYILCQHCRAREHDRAVQRDDLTFDWWDMEHKLVDNTESSTEGVSGGN